MEVDGSTETAQERESTGGAGASAHPASPLSGDEAGGASRAAASPKPAAQPTQVIEAHRMDVSAATVTRMLGIATSSDLRLLEGRLDLVTAKMAGMVTKLDRVLALISSVPSAADIDRLEVQIGGLKGLIREVLEQTTPGGSAVRELEGQRSAAQEQSRKLREGIKTSAPDGEPRPVVGGGQTAAAPPAATTATAAAPPVPPVTPAAPSDPSPATPATEGSQV